MWREAGIGDLNTCETFHSATGHVPGLRRRLPRLRKTGYPARTVIWSAS
jgi:hypothetical protein